MARLFRSKSCSLNTMPPPLYEDDEGGYFGDYNYNTDDEEEEEEEDDGGSENPATTPFLSPGGNGGGNQAQFSVLGVVAAALRKSLVTCSVDADDVASDVDIGWPTDVRHVSHVTFDRFDGFLGLPVELQPEVPSKPPSASASVFGVSAQSMQCSFDQRGNSVPTILLRMQTRLYEEGGLQAEGIFRINAENSQEENVRKQLNKGIVPHGIDVHCLSGLIKAWFRELPSGVLDCLSAEDVMHCNTEEECSELVKQLPPTEGALLDWAINLMADVVQHHHLNKMNARNIAMVFAPNMTQMADPLTALIHAVQVMNFLKTLIGKTLAEREEYSAVLEQSGAPVDEECNNAEVMSSGETTPATTAITTRKRRTLGHSFKDEYEADDGILRRLNLRKGMQKLCRHPVFHLTKTQPKKLYNSN
ncbi:rho GTPase-activating protein 5-like isoform X1 [Salvia hispanica]|uniref:rho GTPase-activating protein 5-like isoform X1 n=1 Tax=Salvia hispanica TaxID=49212 RepID=UPI002008F918|nr:rho GTPase-activating protein 5-like isoform X1 [Salvia hispanica]